MIDRKDIPHYELDELIEQLEGEAEYWNTNEAEKILKFSAVFYLKEYEKLLNA